MEAKGTWSVLGVFLELFSQVKDSGVKKERGQRPFPLFNVHPQLSLNNL